MKLRRWLWVWAMAGALLAPILAAGAQELIRDAVICRSVGDRGQPISPDTWFPEGTKSLTVWFRTGDLPREIRAQVHWTLNSVTLTKKDIVLRPNQTGFHRYSLGMGEPLPSGLYEAMIRIDNRIQARASARVGGRRPEATPLTALPPTSATEQRGGAGLMRADRTQGVAAVPEMFSETPPEAASTIRGPRVGARTDPSVALEGPAPVPPPGAAVATPEAPGRSESQPSPLLITPAPETPPGVGGWTRLEWIPGPAPGAVINTQPGSVAAEQGQETGPRRTTDPGSTETPSLEPPASGAEQPPSGILTTASGTSQGGFIGITPGTVWPTTASHEAPSAQMSSEGGASAFSSVPVPPTRSHGTAAASSAPVTERRTPGARDTSAPRPEPIPRQLSTAPAPAATPVVLATPSSTAGPRQFDQLATARGADPLRTPVVPVAPQAREAGRAVPGTGTGRGTSSASGTHSVERLRTGATREVRATGTVEDGQAVGPWPAIRIVPSVSAAQPASHLRDLEGPSKSSLVPLVRASAQAEPAVPEGGPEVVGKHVVASAVGEEAFPDPNLLAAPPDVPTAVLTARAAQPPSGGADHQPPPRPRVRPPSGVGELPGIGPHGGDTGQTDARTAPAEEPGASDESEAATDQPTEENVVVVQAAGGPTIQTDLVLGEPLVADVVAEDLPAVQLAADAVKLYRLELIPVAEPRGLQPMWIVREPDGRLWPPTLPTQLGLYAGETPTVSPADRMLYSDHIDGVIPIYDVPAEEARLLAARENEASFLHVGRDLFDHRRAAWQKTAQGWQWMWFVRELDLQRGDVVLGCLTDLGRSRRAPEGFTPQRPHAVVLLDETGRVVPPADLSPATLEQVAQSLPPQAQAVALSGWVAPAAGRYQLWAALGLETCRARCLVWLPGTPGTR